MIGDEALITIENKCHFMNFMFLLKRVQLFFLIAEYFWCSQFKYYDSCSSIKSCLFFFSKLWWWLRVLEWEVILPNLLWQKREYEKMKVWSEWIASWQLKENRIERGRHQERRELFKVEPKRVSSRRSAQIQRMWKKETEDKILYCNSTTAAFCFLLMLVLSVTHQQGSQWFWSARQKKYFVTSAWQAPFPYRGIKNNFPTTYLKAKRRGTFSNIHPKIWGVISAHLSSVQPNDKVIKRCQCCLLVDGIDFCHSSHPSSASRKFISILSFP